MEVQKLTKLTRQFATYVLLCGLLQEVFSIYWIYDIAFNWSEADEFVAKYYHVVPLAVVFTGLSVLYDALCYVRAMMLYWRQNFAQEKRINLQKLLIISCDLCCSIVVVIIFAVTVRFRQIDAINVALTATHHCINEGNCPEYYDLRTLLLIFNGTYYRNLGCGETSSDRPPNDINFAILSTTENMDCVLRHYTRDNAAHLANLAINHGIVLIYSTIFTLSVRMKLVMAKNLPTSRQTSYDVQGNWKQKFHSKKSWFLHKKQEIQNKIPEKAKNGLPIQLLSRLLNHLGTALRYLERCCRGGRGLSSFWKKISFSIGWDRSQSPPTVADLQEEENSTVEFMSLENLDWRSCSSVDRQNYYTPFSYTPNTAKRLSWKWEA